MFGSDILFLYISKSTLHMFSSNFPYTFHNRANISRWLRVTKILYVHQTFAHSSLLKTSDAQKLKRTVWMKHLNPYHTLQSNYICITICNTPPSLRVHFDAMWYSKTDIPCLVLGGGLNSFIQFLNSVNKYINIRPNQNVVS